MVFQTETDILFGKCENFVYLQDLYLFDIDWAVSKYFMATFASLFRLERQEYEIWEKFFN